MAQGNKTYSGKLAKTSKPKKSTVKRSKNVSYNGKKVAKNISKNTKRLARAAQKTNKRLKKAYKQHKRQQKAAEKQRARVKRLNERFRKIETDERYRGSEYYRLLEQRLNDYPNSARSKAYKVQRDEKGNIIHIRMLNPTELKFASKETRKLFEEELERGLAAKTTTLRGMKKAMTSAVASLKKNETFAENLKNVDSDQIGRAWEMYTDLQNWLKTDNKDFDDTYGYDLMVNYLSQYKGVAEDSNFDELFDRMAGSSGKLREEFDEYRKLERNRKKTERGRKRNEKRKNESNTRRG